MTETSNLHLKKPAGEDFYNVADFNDNADILDAAYKYLSDAQAQLGDGLNGKAPENHTHTPESIGAATAEQGDKADSAVQAIKIGDVEQSKASGVVSLPAYPTSLPADGGNADTLDGKHANIFLQYLGGWTSGSVLTKALELNASGFVYCSDAVTDLPESGKYFFVDIRNSNGSIQLTATRFNNGATYTNRYNTGSKAWYGWKNVADGGNADKVNTSAIDTATNYYLCAVNSNNPSPAAESLSTNAGIRINTSDAQSQILAGFGDSKEGMLALFQSNSAYWSLIRPNGTALTSNTTLRLPNKSGTLALDTAASATANGLVTTGSQTFAGDKTFQGYVYIKNPDYTKSSTAPSTIKFRAHRFLDSANKVMGELSNYVDTNNNTVSKLLATAAGSLDNKVYSQIATLINADASYICHVCTTPTIGVSSLRQMASGTAEATTSNCPDGAWYGQYEEV